jgi:uncharacterized membrane protein
MGRVLFGVPMIIFGIQHFIYADFVVTLMQPWLPWRPFWTYFCGVALIAAGLALTDDRLTRLAATLLGVMIFLFVLLVHIPQALLLSADPHQWTYLTQAFTFSGFAFLLASTSKPGSWPPLAAMTTLLDRARWFLAIGFLILGVRQLLGVPFVIGLVPPWPPSPSVWAGAAAVLLLATSAGIVLKRPRVPALCLGALLLLFLAAHHLPNVVRDARRADWGATCKDSIICGGALVLASTRSNHRGRDSRAAAV